MNEVQISCPLPGGPPPTGDECDTIKTVSWASPGITNTNFFILNTDDTLVRFRFTPISNNGSNIVVNVIYGDDGNREIKTTFNLGQLPSVVDKYHVIDLGEGYRNNQVVTFETVTTFGTSGSFSILFDCNVPIGRMDLCFIPATKNPLDLCGTCPQVFRVFWDNQVKPVDFPQAEIFFDPELQEEAFVGFYRVFNNNLFPVIYFYDGNKLVKQTTCTNYVDCGGSITLTHSKSDYKYSDPYIYGRPENVELKKNLKYSAKTVIVWFQQPQYGRVRFQITLSGGDYEDLGIFLTDANQLNINRRATISYKYEIVKTHRYASGGNFIRKLYTTEFTIDAIINAYGASTQAIAVVIAVGQKKKYKKNNVISTILSTTCVTEVYSYVMGVHPYSPYDAAYSPRCTTELYSFKKIENWVVGYEELVFMDPLFVYPAFPWYYSYENKVYSIGLPVNREFGIKMGYQVKTSLADRFWRWITGEKETVKTTPIVYGPQNWIGKSLNRFRKDFDVLPNCVQTFVTWGFIGAILEKNSLKKPTKYVYYLGYDEGVTEETKYNCVDIPFSYWDFLEARSYPIGGYRHSISYSPVIAPLVGQTAIDAPDWYYYPWAEAANGFFMIATGLIVYGYLSGILFATAFPDLALTIASTLSKKGVESVLTISLKGGAFCAGPQATVCGIIIAAIIYTIILIEFFRTEEINYTPKCEDIYKCYSTKPYLNVGDRIYYNSNLTGINDGYYSDGAYIYHQIGQSIVTKEIAYYHPDGVGTNRLLPVEPTPDNPTFIESVPSLWFLCYISGVPDGAFSEYFVSDAISLTFNKSYLDGDLLSQSPINYDLPQGLFFSTISQEDANQKAQFYLDSLTANTAVQISIQKPSVGDVVSQFTHELKIETNPTIIQLAFDNFDNLGVTLGKKLYYDDDGYFSVLDGFYAVLADDNTNYKYFYQTFAGEVIDIWVMETSESTTVTSQVYETTENLIQTNLNFSSSWYLTSQNSDNLINLWAPNSIFTSADTWNSSTFYSNPGLVRGFIDTPSTKEVFYLFDSNFNLNSYSIAQEAFYQEIPLVFNKQPFPYLTGETLTLNVVQECSETPEFNGIRVTCFDDGNIESPAFNGVEFVVNLYLNSNSQGTNQVLTYNLKIESYQYEVFQIIDTSYIGQIIDGEISTILSQNPVQGFLYSAGTFTSCNTPTPTPTPITWTVTPTESNTPTPTKTPTSTPTPTITPSSGGINCDEYYNNTSNPLTGVNYTDCNGIEYTNITVNAGDGICVLEGTLNGGDSGFLTNLGTCGRYYPSATPTPTTSQTPSFTPTHSVTPTSELPFAPISLSTAQIAECNACGLTTYSVTGYTDPFDSYPTSGDTVYSNSSGTLLFNGAGQWFKTSWGSPFAQFSIRINSLGIVTGVVNCAICATNTPTPSVTPTYTPTYSETPTNTPTYPETPTNTPTYTETPTPTASGVPCYEYTATASQSDIDASDDGTVYFQYIDCITGSTQIVTRGVADVPSNAVCARSIGSIYIIVSGNQSPASSSSWSLPGASC